MRTRSVRAALGLGILAAGVLVPVGGRAEAETPAPTFTPFEAYPTGSWPQSVAIGDFTGDGRLDVAMSTSVYGDSSNNSKVLLYAQQVDGTLALSATIATDGLYGDQMGLAAGDLDGDGLTDVALATGQGIDVFFQRAGTLAAGQLISTLPGRHVEIADLDGDGHEDIVVNGGGVHLLAGLGGTAFATPATVTPDSLVEIEVGDVTGDGRPDVVGFSGKTVKVYAQQQSGGFATAAPYDAVVGYWPNGAGIEVADLTGDGRPDVALSIAGNRPGSLINVFAQQSDGTLASPAVYPVLDIPEPLEAADLTGDGQADLVTAHGGWNAAGALVQQTDGTLGGEATYLLPYASHYNTKGLALGDLNVDGRVDLAVADSNNGLVVLRQGTPPPPTTTTAPGGDTDPPETTITQVEPETFFVYDAITFSFSSDEPESTFICHLDGDQHLCSSPITYSGLSEGIHAFDVAAVDAAGNIDPTPAMWDFHLVRTTDLAAAMTDSPDPVRPRGDLTYAVTVTNRSKVSTDDVIVEHVRPSATDLVSTPSDCVATSDPSTVRCPIGTLGPGETATVQIVVRVSAQKGTVLDAGVHVTSARVDRNPDDNEAIASTLVWAGQR